MKALSWIEKHYSVLYESESPYVHIGDKNQEYLGCFEIQVTKKGTLVVDLENPI